MGDLALALHQQGHTVTGSDLHFPAPMLQRLTQAGLALGKAGWFPQKISQSIDQVILGRQVQPDNREIKAAQQLGLPIYSYPEYIYHDAANKQRIVIIGGKEGGLICELTLQVLSRVGRAFDYVVDTPALATSVHLSDAPIILLAGDLAPSSPIDPQPQSLHYQHNIVVVNNISGEERSPYPTPESYLAPIKALVDGSPKGGTVIYNEADGLIRAIGEATEADVKKVPYKPHSHSQKEGQAYLTTPEGDVLFPYTDKASLFAVAAAQQLLRNLAVTDQQFYEALAAFSG